MKKTTLILFFIALLIESPSFAQTAKTVKAFEPTGLKTSITWENIRNTPAPLPLIGHIKPVASSFARPSRWSIGVETLDRDYSVFENFKGFIGQTGVGYGRLQSGWAKTEKEKGVYDFEWLDVHVDGLIEQGVHPWICLCYGNPIYSDDGYDLNAKIFGEGKVMDAWEKYVAAVVKRYKGKVTMYEVWNEPDGGGQKYGPYVTLFDHTSKVIRKYDKEVKIAALGLADLIRKDKDSGERYIVKVLQEMKAVGCLNRMDYLTYHAYWPVPERIIPWVKDLREQLQRLGSKAEILQGETGCPACLEYAHALANFEWTEYSQAKWDLRQMIAHFGVDVPYSIFTMVDLNYGWMMQSFGLIRMKLNHEPVYLRPKFYAVQHVTSVFGPDITPDENVKVESSCGRDIYCVGIQKNGKTIGCALWFNGQRPDSSLERTIVNVRISGVDWGNLSMRNTVYVDMLSGNVHSMPELKNNRGRLDPDGSLTLAYLPLWDCPILIIDKSAVNY